MYKMTKRLAGKVFSFLIIIIMFADASFLFCMESHHHDNHHAIDNVNNCNNSHSENEEEPHNPFHIIHHSSQITVNNTIDPQITNCDIIIQKIQNISFDLPVRLSVISNNILAKRLKQKFRFISSKEHISFLSILII